jgi:hypothetical protein
MHKFYVNATQVEGLLSNAHSPILIVRMPARAAEVDVEVEVQL